jgi:2-phosphoglycolate phosphatase
MRAGLRGVLFDLDGTLIDSAPDLAAAANALRAARGLEPMPYERLRPMVGSGARGMVGVAMGRAPGDAEYDALREEFLARYEAGLLQHTQVFATMQPVIDALDAARLPWGIVTNKIHRYADPVIAGLGLAQRASVVIAGDSTPHSKPHPAPLLEAARRLGLAPAACVYVGDDLRDVQAGRAAGMATVAAAWGYLGQGEAIEHWGADKCVETPAQLLDWQQLP